MRGLDVIVQASRKIPRSIEDLLTRNQLKPADVGIFLMHQANVNLIRKVATVPLRPRRPLLSQHRPLWQHLLRLPSHRRIRVARRQSHPTHISYRLRSLWRRLQLGSHPCSPRINSCIQASFLHKMTMSENRQSGSPPDEKICTWNCPIEKFVIVHCRAEIPASTASSS